MSESHSCKQRYTHSAITLKSVFIVTCESWLPFLRKGDQLVVVSREGKKKGIPKAAAHSSSIDKTTHWLTLVVLCD